MRELTGDSTTSLRAVDARTGDELWTSPLSSVPDLLYTVDGVVAGQLDSDSVWPRRGHRMAPMGRDGLTQLRDLDTGRVLDLAGAFPTWLTADDATVPGVLPSLDDRLVGWDLDTGRRAWQVSSAGTVDDEPRLVVDGVLATTVSSRSGPGDAARCHNRPRREPSTMTADRDVRTSKQLSYVLRHAPGSVGLTLDAAGWVPVPELLAALEASGQPISRDDVVRVVAQSDKQRFELDPSGDRIRARQGHSIDVDLDLPVAVPPPVLFHGTPSRNVEAILAEGLNRGARHHVHLSADEATATAVGRRRGTPVVLRVDAAAMHRDGREFFVTGNGVWLTDHVPPRYLEDRHLATPP